MSLDLSNIINWIGYGGILAGYVSAIYLVWRKRKKISIFGGEGTYSISPSSRIDCNNIYVNASLIVHNPSNEAISLTDILAIIRYDKKLFSENVQLISKTTGYSSPYRSERPTTSPDGIPITLGSNEAKRLNLLLRIDDLMVNFIDRYALLHFVGFNKDKPVFVGLVNGSETLWEERPLIMGIFIHVNGEKVIKSSIGLHKINEKKSLDRSGTFSSGEIAYLQKEFWEGKK